MPVARAARAPRPSIPLSEDRILEAARALVEATGAAAFSMRALAGSLGVTPMALYNWFDNREALLQALSARAVDAFEVPDADGPWEERAVALASAFRDHLREHYAVTALASANELIETVMIQAADQGVRLMTEIGFDGADAVSALRALLWHAVGYALVVDADPDLPRPVAELTARSDVATDAVTALLPHFARFDRDREFDFSVRTLVRGLASAPGRAPQPRSTR